MWLTQRIDALNGTLLNTQLEIRLNKPLLTIAAIPLALALLLGEAAAVRAQTPASAAPAIANKPVPKRTARPPVSPERAQLKSEAKSLAAAVVAADLALTPEELAVADRVHVGQLPCELGESVTLTADPASPGYFDVQLRKLKFRMFPVATTTGAIRLEDKKSGAVWLQLGNKSMLMNARLGQRLADECMSPQQAQVAAALKLAPPIGLLDSVPQPSNLRVPSQADVTLPPPVAAPASAPIVAPDSAPASAPAASSAAPVTVAPAIEPSPVAK